MKVSIAGTGYVGLVSGVCLAELGHEVVCVDIDSQKVEKINRGIPPIYEEGLEKLLKKNISSRLSASTNLHQAVLNSELTLIAVGTPFDGQHIDLGYIEAVSAEIGAAISEKTSYHAVIVKSTVVPGTTDNVVLPILEKNSGKKAGDDFGVGMNPEFLKEGEAIQDFMNPDRIVMGGIDQRSKNCLQELYAAYKGVDKLETSCRTAEMIKYTANSLLATLISFSNEIGNLCAAVGDIDVTEVMQGVHLDKRLSPILESGERITPAITTYIEAGCGFGGSCFPKDVKALVAYGQAQNLPMNLLDSVVDINVKQPYKILSILNDHYPNLSGLNIAVLGLSFKPGSDDMRESPAIPIVTGILEGNGQVTAFDPIAEEESKKVFSGLKVRYASTLSDAIKGVDVIIIVTRWPIFTSITTMLEGKVKQPLVIDGRRMLEKDKIERYTGIGIQVTPK